MRKNNFQKLIPGPSLSTSNIGELFYDTNKFCEFPHSFTEMFNRRKVSHALFSSEFIKTQNLSENFKIMNRSQFSTRCDKRRSKRYREIISKDLNRTSDKLFPSKIIKNYLRKKSFYKLNSIIKKPDTCEKPRTRFGNSPNNIQRINKRRILRLSLNESLKYKDFRISPKNEKIKIHKISSLTTKYEKPKSINENLCNCFL